MGAEDQNALAGICHKPAGSERPHLKAEGRDARQPWATSAPASGATPAQGPGPDAQSSNSERSASQSSDDNMCYHEDTATGVVHNVQCTCMMA